MNCIQEKRSKTLNKNFLNFMNNLHFTMKLLLIVLLASCNLVCREKALRSQDTNLDSSIAFDKNTSDSPPTNTSPNAKSNDTGNSLDNSLLDSVKTKDIKLVKQLLAQGANPNAIFWNKSSQINDKAKTENRRQGQSVLSIAVHGNPEIVETLLKNGADVNRAFVAELGNDKTVSWSSTPLEIAVSNDYVSVIEVLLANGADIEKASQDEPLLFAANDKETIEVLVKHEIDINKPDKNGTTALMKAVEQGYYGKERRQFDKVKSLIKYGANVNYRNKSNDFTALKMATDMNDKEMIKLLKKSGAKK